MKISRRVLLCILLLALGLLWLDEVASPRDFLKIDPNPINRRIGYELFKINGKVKDAQPVKEMRNMDVLFMTPKLFEWKVCENSPRKNVHNFMTFLSFFVVYGIMVYLHSNYKSCSTVLNQEIYTKIIAIKTVIRESVPCYFNKLTLTSKELLSSLLSNSFTFGIKQDTYAYFSDESLRVTTFKTLNSDSSPVSFLVLSENGFFYTKNAEIVECCHCGKHVNLSEFCSHPSASQFHASPTCPYVKTISTTDSKEDDVVQKYESRTGKIPEGQAPLDDDPSADDQWTKANYGETMDQMDGAFGGSTITSMDVSPEQNLMSVDAVANGNGGEPNTNSDLGQEERQHCDTDNSSRKETLTVPSLHTLGASQNTDGSEFLGTGARPKSHSAAQVLGTGARPKSHSAAQVDEPDTVKQIASPERKENEDNFYWTDEKSLSPEGFCLSANSPHPEVIWNKPCEKNEVHDSFFPIPGVKMCQFPDNLQIKELFELVHLFATLVAKLKMRRTSQARPKSDPCREKFVEFRFGTGFVIPESDQDKATHIVKANQGQDFSKSIVTKLKQFLSSTKGHFSLQTSRHVVFDDFEAVNTEVIFDVPDRKNGKLRTLKAKGVKVIHDDVEGVYSSILICKTSETELLCLLMAERKRLVSFQEKLSTTVMNELVDNCIVISHPHGKKKMVTFGESTIVKYALVSQATSPAPRQLERLIYCTEKCAQQDIREMLMHTAGTCNGSSGAVVLTSRNIQPSAGKDKEAGLVLWIHNGVVKQNGLGGSVMKMYTPPTVSTEPSKTKGNNSGSENNAAKTSESHSSTDSGRHSAPPNPVYMSYVTMMSRLDSFNFGYQSKCKHSPIELASAGFFFAGNNDCIKCFNCGLGLQNWNEKSDVYKQHQRHMPSCSFLKVHMDSTIEIDPAFLPDGKYGIE